MALSNQQAETAARALVTRYAPDAPTEVVTAAMDLLRQAIRLPVGVEEAAFSDQTVHYEGRAGADLLRRSGAASLLASYRRPRARVIEAAS